jgi:Na+/H+-dicarboxylate symporter
LKKSRAVTVYDPTTVTSSTKILVGLVAGVIVGLFFGEHAGVLKMVADGFVKLLQMSVLPYITLSIITSLGTLGFDQVKTLGLRAGVVLLGLWCLALVFTFLLPLAFPATETASFFSTILVERRRPFNFVDLFIPSNPFYSLANNIVPAALVDQLHPVCWMVCRRGGAGDSSIRDLR